MLPIIDRSEAGRELAEALAHYGGRRDVLVLALPRGGVPVAYEIATALAVSLDLMLVRKLGAPEQRELAMGAIASGGIRILNEDLIRTLRVSESDIDSIAEEEQRELERRERAYRGDRPRQAVGGRTVILVDDGVATGATMRAAIASLRRQNPARIVIALPLAPASTLDALAREADEVICLHSPEPFVAIGRWYQDFTQVSDREVRELLARIQERTRDDE